jgi:hypothetical protein
VARQSRNRRHRLTIDAILWPDGDENRVGLLPKLVEEDRLSRKNVFDEVIDKSIHAGEGAFLTPSIVPMLSADGTEADMTVFGPTSEDDPNETSAPDRRRPDFGVASAYIKRFSNPSKSSAAN